MLASIPAIHENKRYVNYLCPSFPLHSKLGDAQLWYIGCSNTAFIRWSQMSGSSFKFCTIFLRLFFC